MKLYSVFSFVSVFTFFYVKNGLLVCLFVLRASLVAQRLKHLPGMWETRVRSLDREDPVEKAMAPHSSTLAWRIPWREEPGRLQSMGSQRVGHDWATSLSLTFFEDFLYFYFWLLWSLLLHSGFLYLQYTCFSLQWLLLSWSTGSRAWHSSCSACA